MGGGAFVLLFCPGFAAFLFLWLGFLLLSFGSNGWLRLTDRLVRRLVFLFGYGGSLCDGNIGGA